MADEGDSKSLVLITRVGSTPTTGIKKKLPSLSGEFSFLSAACERVEQHGPALQGERSALLTLRDGEQAGIEGEAVFQPLDHGMNRGLQLGVQHHFLDASGVLKGRFDRYGFCRS